MIAQCRPGADQKYANQLARPRRVDVLPVEAVRERDRKAEHNAENDTGGGYLPRAEPSEPLLDATVKCSNPVQNDHNVEEKCDRDEEKGHVRVRLADVGLRCHGGRRGEEQYAIIEEGKGDRDGADEHADHTVDAQEHIQRYVELLAVED